METTTTVHLSIDKAARLADAIERIADGINVDIMHDNGAQQISQRLVDGEAIEVIVDRQTGQIDRIATGEFI